MINEIYCRMPNDVNYKDNILDTNDEVEIILQRIRVCLGTKPGQVLGDAQFGIDLEDYLFDMSLDQQGIETEIRDLIYNKAMMGYTDRFSCDVNVSFGHNTEDMSDYMLIDIYLNDTKLLGILVT